MDKQSAVKIIRDTFERPFEKERFVYFIRNLFNKIEEETFEYHGQYIPDAFKPYIGRYERIGKYKDGDNRIDILAVHLTRRTSIERARTMQRNFIAGYLNGKYGSDSVKDAVLAAFVSPNEEDWRFSLIKMDYKLTQTDSGKTNAKEELTHARRYSFLVGKNEPNHTAQSQLFPLLQDDINNPTLLNLEKAFNIEKVTKEFFEKYRELFLWTKDELDKIVKNDKKVSGDFEAKNVNTVDFAKKLLGQIVFLYFLQKKGWFGVERDSKWGTGSKHFLRELYKKKHCTYNNFFNDILEPLFYEALRIDRTHDDNYYSRFNCKIPFLNGGLFDPINNYDWVHTDILIPNKLFSNSTKTKEGDIGDGILDIFDRYNFTVKEDEPLEKEVAVDPELLGKLYEKFNAIRPDNFDEYVKALKLGQKGAESKFNKQYGVYYTPREIVHYMCQQSLINYSCSEFEEKTVAYEKIGETQLDMLGNIPKKGQLDLVSEHKEGTKISKEDIEILIKYGEHVSENEATVTAKGKETDTYYYKLPESIRQNAKLIDDKLANLKVCDPAVGSGAFLVGMMSEIVKTRNVLSAYYSKGLQPLAASDGRTTYQFKRECIEKSLYGVDIDAGAVEIAKLRLWLSLVVDEEDIKQIKPLPNLDYKIVCGNSLMGVEKNLFNDALFHELERLKPLLFNETNPTKKQEYKKQIDELISQITNGHKEFDFEVYFSEVFHEKKIEKEWEVFHITWVTHNSRRNENIAESKTEGTNPILLSLEDRNKIAEILSNRIKEKGYRALALNVLDDHVHLLLVCEENEVSSIVGNLKGYSSHEFHASISNHTGCNHTVNRMVAGTEEGASRSDDPTPTYSDGTIRKLWAARYSDTFMRSDEHFASTVEYILNNHFKHTVNRMALPPIDFTIVQPALTPLDKAFSPITKQDGFDVVIANPPYVKEYVNRKAFDGIRNSPYYQGKMDIWYLFACKGIDHLRDNGLLTFIAQNNWVTSYGASKMRTKVISDTKILSLLDFGDYKIFETSGIQTMVMIFQRDKETDNYPFDYRRISGEKISFENVLDLLNYRTNSANEYLNPKINRNKLINQPLTFSNSNINAVFEKMLSNANFHLNKTEVANGIHHHHDSVDKERQKILGGGFEIGDGIFVLSDKEKKDIPFLKIELELLKPSYTTKELHKWYGDPKNKEWVIYTDSSFKDHKNIKPFPNIKAHLDKFKKVITSDNKSYGLHRARNENFFKGEKIIAVRKCAEPTFTYTNFDCYVSATFYVIKSERLNLKYLTAILNSTLISF